MNKLVGNRTYISAMAIMLHQVLNQAGLINITGEQVSGFIDVGLAICVLVFRWLANRE
jgi:hypothetical protein